MTWSCSSVPVVRAHGGEDVRPHVQHREHVVPVIGVRCVQEDRPVGQVEPGVGVERVEVGPDDGAEVSGREGAQVVKLVGRAEPRADTRRQVDDLLPSDLHRHQWVRVDVGLTAQGPHIARQDAHSFPPLGARPALHAGAVRRATSCPARDILPNSSNRPLPEPHDATVGRATRYWKSHATEDEDIDDRTASPRRHSRSRAA